MKSFNIKSVKFSMALLIAGLMPGLVLAQESPAVTLQVPSPSQLQQRLSVNYVAETWSTAAPINDGDFDSYRAEHHLGLAYLLSGTRSLQLRQYFYYNLSDPTSTNEVEIGDHAIQYSDSGLAPIGANPVYGYARLYLPGGEFSREVGKYELRLFGSVQQRVSDDFTVRYELNPRLYSYTTNNDGQMGGRIRPGVFMDYDENNNFIPYIGAYSDHVWRRSGLGINRDLTPQTAEDTPANSDSLIYVLGAKMQFTPNISFHLYTETEDDLRDSESAPLLSEENTVYGLDISVNL